MSCRCAVLGLFLQRVALQRQAPTWLHADEKIWQRRPGPPQQLAARSKACKVLIAEAGLRWWRQGPKQSHLQLQLHLQRLKG